MGDLVSVIITSYNCERFIQRAVESILSQTHSNLECIVVDDGSQDRTASIVRDISDVRVQLIEPGRIGRARALNMGLREARGKLIAIQDADDISHPGRLGVQVGLLRKHQDAALVGTGQRIIASCTDVNLEDYRSEEIGNGKLKDVHSLLPFLNPISHSSLMIRREVVREVNGYDETRRNLFDWDLLLRLSARGYSLYKYSVPLVFKRIHEKQFFENKERWEYISSCFSLQRRAMKELHMNPLFLPVLVGLFIYRLFPSWFRLTLRRFYGHVAPAHLVF